MEKAVEVFVLINFFVIGLSHVFQAKEWVALFKILRSHGCNGVMANGFLSLIFGSIIVAFHWVWVGVIPIIITSIGVAQIIKSLIALVVPKLSLRTLSTPMAENPNGYRVGGAISIGLSVLIAIDLFNF